MNICERIESGKFVVTSEMGPPKGTDVSRMLEDAELVKARVDAINVTDQQSAVMRMGAIAACRLLIERGHDVVYQLTCRDRNRIALQSDLLSAYALGVRNILALTGDYPSLGDHPQAKPVFDIDSVQLLEVIAKLSSGADMMGNPLKGAPSFCAGAVVNPGADPIEPELIKMEKKIEAGAKFFQTQAVFDMDLLRSFAEKARGLGAPILGGVMLLKSEKMARYVNEHVAGVSVPDSIINEMAVASDKRAKSVEIAVRLIRKMRPITQGIHIMPIGWDRIVPRVLDEAGL